MKFTKCFTTKGSIYI